MSSPLDDQIEQAMADFRLQQGRLLAARRELEQGSVTRRSKDRMLEVTMTLSGELTAIKFHGVEYARVPPAQLSAVLIATINDARAQAAAKVQAGFAPFADFGTQMRESLAGSTDLEELLRPLQEVLRAAPVPLPNADDDEENERG